MSLTKLGAQIKITAASTTLEDLEVETLLPRVLETKRQDFLYFRGRAISAFETSGPNGNGDAFPRKELEASYQTFIGRNLFLNHESDNPIKSIGRILDAYPVEDPETGEFYIECLGKIDRKLHPEIARKIETGELDKTSMGCSCTESTCSICGLTIYSDADEKCEHLSANGLLNTYTAEIDFPEYNIKKGVEQKAFAINKGITFNEWSIVNVPADSKALIKTVFANLKHQLNKKGSLTKEEQLSLVAQMESVLGQLDNQTKEQIRAEFCGCPVKEDSTMSDEKSKSIEATSKTEVHVDEEKQILSKLNGWEFMRLMESIQKKEQKKVEATQVVSEPVKVEANKDESFLHNVVDKVKNSLAGKMFTAAVKRAAEEELNKKPVELVAEKKAEPVIRTEFKKDEADLAKSTWTLIENDKQLVTATLGEIWEDELPMFQDWATSEDYGKAITSKYKADGLEKVTSLLKGSVTKDAGHVSEKYDVTEGKGKMFDAKDFFQPGSDSSNKEDKVKTEYHLGKPGQENGQKGPAAPALENVKTEYDIDSASPEKGQKGPAAPKPTEVKTEYDVAKPKGETGKDFVTPTDPKEEKAHEKSEKKVENEYKAEEVDKGLTEGEKAAKADLDAPKVEKKAEEMAPEVKKEETMEKPADMSAMASAFDKLKEKIVLGDGFEAHKDLETKEIVVTDMEGKEVKRLPDGFGDDVVSVMKLLRSLLNLPAEEEKKDEVKEEIKIEEPKLEEIHEEPKMEEPKVEEVEMEELPMESKKEDTAQTKQAEDLAKKEAELKAREEQISKKESELRSNQFGTAINARLQKCRKIVESMIDKDLLEIDEAEIEAQIESKVPLLDARKVALSKAVNKQVNSLLALDDTALEHFAKSITGVKKVASKGLNKPLHVSYDINSADEQTMNNIFKSMGTLKGQ